MLIWCGQRYFIARPHGAGFRDSTGAQTDSDAPPSSSATATSITEDHTIDGCRTALERLSRKALMPLEEKKDFSESDARDILQKTQRDLGLNQFDPGYNRLMQACGMLARVLQERHSVSQRLLRGDAAPAATITSSLKTSGGLSPLTGSRILGSTADFFRKRAIKDWSERCTYYRPLLDRLLIPST